MLNLTADPERVKHLLITARDELKARGWMQRSYGVTDGPKCTVGAITWASVGRPKLDFLRNEPPSQAQLDAEYVLSQVVGVSAFIVEWNDADGRTEDEVIAAFDAGIALVDAEIVRRRVVQVQSIANRVGIETTVPA